MGTTRTRKVPSGLDGLQDSALTPTLDNRPPVFGDCYEKKTRGVLILAQM